MDRLARLEAAVQRDEGGRGLVDLCLPPGELAAAARALHDAAPGGPILVLTGFPCLLQHTPPTETDGPPGALAIARACIGLGKRVVLLIEEANARVLEAAVAAAATDLPPAMLRLETFPPLPRWTAADDARLAALAHDARCVVAIERAGPSVSEGGHYYSLRGLMMDEVVAPVERVLDLVPPSVESIGIGDGGNEVGMGKVQNRVLASTCIPNAATIACRTATTYLLAASVSNWGGYALCCALAVVAAEAEGGGQEADKEERIRRWVERLVVTEAQDAALLEAIVAAGARDGLTGERQAWVDGMPGQQSLEMLRELRQITTNE